MNRENVEKWVAALRSGEFPQTKGLLHRVVDGQPFGDDDELVPAGFCCLGVGCVVAGIEETEGGNFRDRSGEACVTMPPIQFYEWLDLPDGRDPSEWANELAQANDEGASFEQIADQIEDMFLKGDGD